MCSLHNAAAFLFLASIAIDCTKSVFVFVNDSLVIQLDLLSQVPLPFRMRYVPASGRPRAGNASSNSGFPFSDLIDRRLMATTYKPRLRRVFSNNPVFTLRAQSQRASCHLHPVATPITNSELRCSLTISFPSPGHSILVMLC